MSDSPIRLVLVDDHSASREPLAELLNRQPDLTVVGQAGSLAEGRALLDTSSGIDVAVVDLDLSDGSGAEFIRDLHRTNPEAYSLVLTGSRDPVERGRAVEAGAAHVLHKSAPIREIIDAVRRVCAGETLLPSQEVAELVRHWTTRRVQEAAARTALEQLTPREREILQALADGLGDKAIADKLSLSDRTVRNHVTSILGKLRVGSRLQALVLAVRLGAVRIS